MLVNVNKLEKSPLEHTGANFFMPILSSTPLNRTMLIASLITPVALVSNGCSDSSSSRTPTPPPVASELFVSISFPPNSAATDGRSALLVSGTLEDKEDGELTSDDITSFTVNGVAASVDYQLGRWQATIELPTETVEISTDLIASNGSANQASVSVDNSTVPDDYRLLEVSADGRLALIYGNGTVRRVDLTSAEETPIAEGLNVDASPILGIHSDAHQENSYLVRRQLSTLYDVVAVDSATMDWKQLTELPSSDLFWNSYHAFDYDPTMQQLVLSFQASSEALDKDMCELRISSVATGENLVLADTDAFPVADGGPTTPICTGPVVVDASNNRVITAAKYSIDPDTGAIIDADQLGLYSYALNTGAAQIVSDENVGTGPLLNAPEWLFISLNDEQLLAVDRDKILTVDTTSGNRTLVLESPELPSLITDMDFDEVNQRLLVTTGGKQLHSLNLVDGSLTTLLDEASVGSGPAIDPIQARVIDSNNNRLYSVDARHNRLLSMDLTTLSRTVIVEPVVPNTTDSPESIISSLALDPVNEQLFYFADKQVLTADTSSATVRTIASDTQGTGPVLHDVRGLSFDPSQGLLYASASYDDTVDFGLISIDTNTGDRKLISSALTSSSNNIQSNLFDEANNRVIATTAGGAIVSIDLNTEERNTLLQNVALADGTSMRSPTHIAWDSEAGRLLVEGLYGSGTRGVVSVDLETGANEIIKSDIGNLSFDTSTTLMYSYPSGESNALIVTDRYTEESATVSRLEY